MRAKILKFMLISFSVVLYGNLQGVPRYLALSGFAIFLGALFGEITDIEKLHNINLKRGEK